MGRRWAGAARVDKIQRKPAMANRNVNLTEHFDRLIESDIEVVRDGLRLLEQQNAAKLQALGLFRCEP